MADEKNWEARLASLAGAYAVGQEAVSRRRKAWHACADTTILATLERAAEVLRKSGLPHAKAKRIEFGENVEAVQLYTGQHDNTQAFLRRGANGAPALVIEVGATLGYSVGVSGQVMHWHRRHWLTGFGDDHPKWDEIALLDDASVLTKDVLEGNVEAFLRFANATSYLAAVASGKPNDQIGFFMPTEEGE